MNIEYKKIYFIGIGGIGVSALARICNIKGVKVYGSDINNTPLTKELESKGIIINYNHNSLNITKDIDLVVKTSAVKSNPEIDRAKELNIPIMLRGEFLSYIANQYRLISIAGSHGKTTTSTILTYILKQYYPNLSFNIGGILKNYNTNSEIFDGEFFLSEADESDGSFLFLKSEIALINNLDPEHLDYYGSFENLKKAVLNFAKKSKKVIWCLDDKNLRDIFKSQKGDNFLTFGNDFNADFFVNSKTLLNDRSDYKLNYKDKSYNIKLPLPGDYNILNMSGALSVALTLGLDISKIDMKDFKSVKRRFEKIESDKNIDLYDDYAHHPVEIDKLFNTILNVKKRVIILYQPHRYSRTKDNFEQIISVLKRPKNLIIVKEYAASEKIIEGATAFDIYNKLSAKNYNFLSFVKSIDEGVDLLNKITIDGDLICSVGAGNVNQILYKFS